MSESEEGEVKEKGKGGKRGAMGFSWNTFAFDLASVVGEAVGCLVLTWREVVRKRKRMKFNLSACKRALRRRRSVPSVAPRGSSPKVSGLRWRLRREGRNVDEAAMCRSSISRTRVTGGH
jgi:hypothetical protein